MGRKIVLTKFKELDLSDPFFDSLKSGYNGFEKWFEKKKEDEVYIVHDRKELSGMLYLKEEEGQVDDVQPALPSARWLKVGTLKIVAKGTKLGERVIKKIFDHATMVGAHGVYVTVFDIHESLIKLFQKYGFIRHGIKNTESGTELVLVKYFDLRFDSVVENYPIVSFEGKRAWLLAVYPEYHTRLLPDSILRNEKEEIIRDVSYTNTIHKVYIGRLPLTRMSVGDIVILYRTSDKLGPAFFRSVATSMCVVEDVKRKKDFATESKFVSYCKPHSVFSEEELRHKFREWPRLYVAKMTYNAAFTKRITRGRLLEEVGISLNPRWDLRELDLEQLGKILEIGEVNESLVVY